MTLLRVMAVLLTVCPTVSPASAIDLAGNVEQLQGSAHATSAAGLSRPLHVGSTILVGDQVSTGTDTRLLLRMNDGAAIALGDGTTLTVAVYDEDESSGRAVLGLEQGVIAMATGAIGRLGPDRFNVNTPVAFLEIQGSEVWVDELPDRLALALLADAAVTATTPQGSVKLTQAETGVDIALGEAPPPPTHWERERLDSARMAAALR